MEYKVIFWAVFESKKTLHDRSAKMKYTSKKNFKILGINEFWAWREGERSKAEKEFKTDIIIINQGIIKP